MSHENVDVVCEHFENTNRRSFDAVMRGYDPNVELVVSEDVAVDPGVYRGAEAVGEWFGSWFRTFASGYRLDVAELFPVDDAVVAVVDHHGVGRLSGVEVTTRVHNVYRVREGKILRIALFRERSEALEAAINSRVATAADLEGLTTTLTAAFEDDPLWTWAFPDPTHLAVYWRFCIGSALRYPCVWITGDYAAASVWIPPAGNELTEEEEERVESLIGELVGLRAPEVLELLERFEASHPRERPHYYLSLLGTHPDHRGQGLGMALLAENLRRMDAEGIPAYLESSNPLNDRRYERLGFRRVGEFNTPGGERNVATMWRDVGGLQTSGLAEP